WRANLRRDVLRSLAGLGRNVDFIQREYAKREKLQKSSEARELYFETDGRLVSHQSLEMDGAETFLADAGSMAPGRGGAFRRGGGFDNSPLGSPRPLDSLTPESATTSPAEPAVEEDEKGASGKDRIAEVDEISDMKKEGGKPAGSRPADRDDEFP